MRNWRSGGSRARSAVMTNAAVIFGPATKSGRPRHWRVQLSVTTRMAIQDRLLTTGVSCVRRRRRSCRHTSSSSRRRSRVACRSIQCIRHWASCAWRTARSSRVWRAGAPHARSRRSRHAVRCCRILLPPLLIDLTTLLPQSPFFPPQRALGRPLQGCALLPASFLRWIEPSEAGGRGCHEGRHGVRVLHSRLVEDAPWPRGLLRCVSTEAAATQHQPS